LLKVPQKNPIIERLFSPLLLQSRHLLRGELNEAEDATGNTGTIITAVQRRSPVKRSQFLCKAQLAALHAHLPGFLCYHHCTIDERRSTLELLSHPPERS